MKFFSYFFIVLLITSMFSFAPIIQDSSAQTSTTTGGADLIQVRVSFGSLNYFFDETPFNGVESEANMGSFETLGPSVHLSYTVTSNTGATNKGDIEMNRIGVKESRDWYTESLNRPNTQGGSFNTGSTPFGSPHEIDYATTMLQFTECTPMDPISFYAAAAESDSNTASTIANLANVVAGLVIAGVGVATTELGFGWALAGLGSAMISAGLAALGADGDEIWGSFNVIKTSPGEYETYTTPGADGKVRIDWKIETTVIEENSPQCVNGQEIQYSLIPDAHEPITDETEYAKYLIGQNFDSNPQWVANIANWWMDGSIDEETFVIGMNYLIENQVIEMRSDTFVQAIDSDYDGIFNNVDKCPTEPETFNDFDDMDGCWDMIELEESSIESKLG